MIASNDLDEYRIAALKEAGAKIDAWGVGTRIAAADGQSALGGVYKLALLRDESGDWQRKAKRSDDPSKASTPGMLQVRRYEDDLGMHSDVIYDELHPPERICRAAPLSASADSRAPALEGSFDQLLQPVLRQGSPVGPEESLHAARARCKSQLGRLPTEVRAARPECAYPVLFEEGLLRERRSRGGPCGVGEPD